MWFTASYISIKLTALQNYAGGDDDDEDEEMADEDDADDAELDE